MRYQTCQAMQTWGEVVCDMIRFVFSKTTSVHSEERTGRQREGWCVTRAQRTFSKASLCLFSISFSLAGAHRLSKVLGGAIYRLARIVWAQGRAKPFKCCSKVVARVTSTLLTSQGGSNSGLAILVTMVAHYMWFVVLRKGSPFFP